MGAGIGNMNQVGWTDRSSPGRREMAVGWAARLHQEATLHWPRPPAGQCTNNLPAGFGDGDPYRDVYFAVSRGEGCDADSTSCRSTMQRMERCFSRQPRQYTKAFMRLSKPGGKQVPARGAVMCDHASAPCILIDFHGRLEVREGGVEIHGR